MCWSVGQQLDQLTEERQLFEPDDTELVPHAVSVSWDSEREQPQRQKDFYHAAERERCFGQGHTRAGSAQQSPDHSKVH